MTRPVDAPSRRAWVRHIPVQWVEPRAAAERRALAIFLPHLTGSADQLADVLGDLASDGFVALSLDPWEHGERGTESRERMMARVFSGFRREMWPILGQTTLDVLKVIEWAVDALGVEPAVRLGGLSMGGDVAVAAAGLDARITRVVPVVATPDWLRPGMRDVFNAGTLVDQGEADPYAQFFFDTLNPLTHLERYERDLEMAFLCGERDTHVPPDGARRFAEALAARHPGSPRRVTVDLIPGLAHLDVRDRSRWWPECRRRLGQPWPEASPR